MKAEEGWQDDQYFDSYSDLVHRNKTKDMFSDTQGEHVPFWKYCMLSTVANPIAYITINAHYIVRVTDSTETALGNAGRSA